MTSYGLIGQEIIGTILRQGIFTPWQDAERQLRTTIDQLLQSPQLLATTLPIEHRFWLNAKSDQISLQDFFDYIATPQIIIMLMHHDFPRLTEEERNDIRFESRCQTLILFGIKTKPSNKVLHLVL